MLLNHESRNHGSGGVDVIDFKGMPLELERYQATCSGLAHTPYSPPLSLTSMLLNRESHENGSRDKLRHDSRGAWRLAIFFVLTPKFVEFVPQKKQGNQLTVS